MSKTLKKVLALVLALTMVIGLAACGGSSKPAETAPTQARAAAEPEPAAEPNAEPA